MRSALRRGLLVTGVMAITAGVGTWVHAATSSRPTTGGSVVGEAPPAEVVGRHADVSDDGRWVVLAGRPPGPDTRTSTVFLRDRAAPDPAGGLSELTVPSPDRRTGDSVHPVISGDGCVVVVVTQIAYDLFRDDDTGERWDVYRLVLPHCGGTPGEWELVSTAVSPDGDVAAGDRADPAQRPAVSASGAVVAYTHRAPGARSAPTQVSVVDLQVPLGNDGRSSLVAGTPLTPPTNEFVHLGQREPAVSDDGSTVVFTSDAIAEAAEPTWGTGPVKGGPATSQVYLWDREAGPSGGVVLVSALGGAPASTGADQPAVSGSGRFVVFRTAARELFGEVALPDCSAGCPAQVVRHDRKDGSLRVVSAAQLPDGAAEGARAAGDGPSGWPAITDDGTQVAFVTRARNLFPMVSAAGVEPDAGDVVVAEVDRAVLRRVSVQAADGAPLAATNANPELSASGHVVVFDTLGAGALDPSDVMSGVADGGGRHVVALARPVTLATAALDVGMVVVGVPGPEWYVAVRNEGPATFMPATVSSSDPKFAVTGGTCALGLPVPPGESCTVYVTFTPDAEGPASAQLTVAEAVFGGTSIGLTVAGTGGEPTLDPTPAGADFEPTTVGERARTVAFDISNIGFAVATISSLELVGDHPGDFAVVGGSCGGATLGPISSCAVEVAFAPTDVGYRSALLRVVADTGQYTTVLVNGIGTRSAQLVVADSEIRAGDDIGVGGTGFAPGATVTIGWADGRGRSTTVQADSSGAFLATLPTRPNETAGERVLVAHAGDVSAQVALEVVRRRSSSPTGV